MGCHHAIGDVPGVVSSSPSTRETRGRPWTSPWRHRWLATHSSAPADVREAPGDKTSGSSEARGGRNAQPRATTRVTDREILAAQRSVEEYLAIPRERMRSFGIIAHVDHGKSTLADRLLEHTGAVPKGGREQYLDRLPVERARGITVKAQSVTLLHECPVTHETYLLNLIDTPGHADFSFEVARSLVACDWALLLVDATQGVQAQTIATFFLALENDLATLPVANKIDAPNADVYATREQMVAAFGMDIPEILCYDDEDFDIDTHTEKEHRGETGGGAKDAVPDDSTDTTVAVQKAKARVSDNPHFLLRASAKTGFGVENVLAAVVRHVPPPVGKDSTDMTDDPKIAPRCRLLDCHYDPYRGAVSTVQVVDGVFRIGDRVVSVATGAVSEILELGFMTPEPLSTKELRGGHVGFLVTSNRDVRGATVGDTLFVAPRNAKFVVERDTDLEEDDSSESDVVTITPLPGLKSAKPMVFQGVFPSSADQFETLRAAIEKLTLNDSSVVYHPETSAALGPGFRCGFLGLLHADVFHQRLKEELGVDVVATAPNVPYRVDYGDGPLSERTKKQSPSSDEESNPELSRWRVVSSPSSFDQERLRRGGVGGVQEPVVDATIVCASDVVGGVVELCVERRGEQLEHSHLGAKRVLLRYRLPLAEMAIEFSDALKSRTSGYATFDYEEAGWRDADVVKLDVLVNGVVVDALSTLTHRSGAVRKGRLVTKKLRDVLPRQLFEVAVQASVNGSIVARETVSAMRKNVIAKCYGGDVSRKKKLLARQKEYKKKMRKIGNVDVPLEAFAGLLGGNQGR